jgi:TolB protein
MRFHTRNLIFVGTSFAIMLAAAVGLIHLPLFSGAGLRTTQANQAEPGLLPPSSTSLDANAAAFKGQGRLAFVYDDRLYVLDGQSGSIKRLTDDGVASKPAWSHDGEWLAFMRAASPQATPVVWLARYDGAQLHPVQESAPDGEFSWAPSDDILAVLGQGGLWLVPVYGRPRYLPGVGLGWSPDGRSLAYNVTLPIDRNQPENRTDALYTASIDGGQPVKRLTAPRGDGIIAVGWWPNGKGLLYWLDPEHSASAMADEVNLYSLRLGDNEPKLLTGGLFRQGWLSIFPDNGLLMVKGHSRIVWADKNLAMINVESADVRDLKNPPGCVAIDPSISTDGTRIAFVAAKNLGNDIWGFDKTEDLTAWVMTRTLWVENADGSGAHPLTSAGKGIYQPRWSKSGRHILYARDNSLWLISAAGGHPERICGPLAYEDPLAGAFGFYGFISYKDELAWFQP